MTQKKKRLGLTIPNELYEKISKIAEQRGKTLNSVCLDCFWDFFEKKAQLTNNGKTERSVEK